MMRPTQRMMGKIDPKMLPRSTAVLLFFSLLGMGEKTQKKSYFKKYND